MEGEDKQLARMNKYKRINFEFPKDKNEDSSDENSISQRAPRPLSTRKYVLACAFFASLDSVLLGYDVGVMSGAIIFIQEDLQITQVQEEILVGILSIVSFLGSLAGGKTSDAIGRKWTMALAAIVFQAGAVTMTVAPSFTVLITGRLLAGIGIGFCVMIAPVYIAEISPAASRGSFTSLPEIFINLGILLGYISNFALSGLPGHLSWRVMLGVGILPSVFTGFALLVIPESPRWLVLRDRLGEARAVLVRTMGDEDEAEQRLEEIKAAAESARCGGGGGGGERAVWMELLVRPSPMVLRMLVVGVGVHCFQQVTGIDALVYYSPEIFKEAGIQDNSRLLGATVAVGVTKTTFILVAIVLIDRVGRKPLLYVSTVGMTVCLLCMGVTLSLELKGKGGVEGTMAILLVCGDVAFFSVGIGPICWVLASEIFPLRLRAQAAALGAAGNRVCSGLVAMSFLSLSSAMTVGGTFFMFSGISLLSVLFVYYYVPETKGRSLEQIEALFKPDGDQGQQSQSEIGGQTEMELRCCGGGGAASNDHVTQQNGRHGGGV